MIILMLIININIYPYSKDIQNEIIVQLDKEIFEFPQKFSNIEINVKETLIHSIDFNNILNKYNIEVIRKGFPRFTDEDSIKINKYGQKIRIPSFSRIFVLELKNSALIDNAIKELKNIKGVVYAEKNLIATTFSDPYYSLQWYLKNNGQSGGTINADINIEPVWSFFTGNSSVKVGIIDEGVLLNHEDLINRVSGDWPNLGTSHGSHVAGIIGANHNGIGIRGVDNACQMISKRIFDSEHYNQYNPSGFIGNVDAANKIIEAVESGCSILNNSWGGIAQNDQLTLHYSFIYAYIMNTLSVVSMGNEGNNGNQITFPAAYGNGQGILTVGAINHYGIRENYSSYGNYIEVMAPGGTNNNNYSVIDIFSLGENNTNSYLYKSGTSMAAPQVTGLASMLKGYNSELSNDDIENIIKLSCNDIDVPGWDQYTGYGSINAEKSFNSIKSPYFISHASINGFDSYYQIGDYQPISLLLGNINGNYYCRKYKVLKNVTFPPTEEAKVWGRGVGTVGYADANLNGNLFNTGFCDVVPLSVNYEHATLYTYVYDIYDELGRHIGWYPCTPENIHLEYTIQGRSLFPSPVIVSSFQNPGIICKGRTGSIECTMPTGQNPTMYNWTWQEMNPSNRPQGVTFSFNRNILTINNPSTNVNNKRENGTPPWYFKVVVSYVNGSFTRNIYPNISTLNYCYSGCPWVVILNSDSSVINENNILHTAQLPNNIGRFITDKYVLKNKPAIIDNKIPISLIETDLDSTIINNVKLYLIEHPIGTILGITSNNQIIVFDSASVIQSKSASLYDNYYNYSDITESMKYHKNIKGNTNGDSYYHIYSIFTDCTVKNPAIITSIQRNKYLTNPPVMKDGITGNFFIHSLDNVFDYSFMRRENPDKIIIPLPEDDLISIDSIHIAWDKNFMIEYAAIASLNYSNFSLTELPLISAYNSINGDVLNNLINNDSLYSFISPLSSINLEFSPNRNILQPTRPIQDYIFEVNGKILIIDNNNYQTNFVTRNNKISSYQLYQNFPNPFNPYTKINYSIKNTGLATIKIYDILGRELYRLVDEEKLPGNYSVDFDASKLSSGIYFYKLEVNGFVDVKRMVLIK